MNKKQKICVITGTRAEFGLLSRVIAGIHEHEMLTLQLVVTGTHLSPEHGRTLSEIREEGFPIAAEVEILLSSDSRVGMSKSMGLAVLSLTDTLSQLKPDCLLILGDRFEILAAAQTAMILGIPIAHIHGGEVTEGAVDDAIRHAVSKMASLHFAASECFKQRLVQMGESEARVYVSGAPGIDNILHTPPLSRQALAQSLEMSFMDKVILLTFHSVTNTLDPKENDVQQLIRALETLQDTSVVITAPNADAGGQRILDDLNAYAEQNPAHVRLVTSLGFHRYLSMLKIVDVVIGNSSSGLIEAPSFDCITINIGPRQKGRPRANSVIDVPNETKAICGALETAMSPTFRNQISQNNENPYGSGGAAQLIISVLSTTDFSKLPPKQFIDLEQVQ
ncbi:UDP-N-acetylglucosamine 2-epimerase [Algicola sagamiensis]|uniref:UDP-N-acetylglucosamine 2-epimerase n=1 Tax=Algicola sagamiensis TaxID=163869 RepID=UPI00037B0598|nr:UDP-N-acetylglucosamine 2-epimerase [Algicola sagamiensis]